MEEKKEKPTIAKLKEHVADYLLIADDGIVDIIVAATIGNMLEFDAIWLMVTAPSSSGKTELLRPLTSLAFITPISDLTTNTFASGYKMGGGKNASLLLQMQNGIMLFLDFTSLLTKGRDSRDEILGQMRMIYDGEYEKKTGTGESITWRGKIGAIAASTTAVYKHLANSTEMGQRFIYYAVKQPDRFEAAKRAQQNATRSTEMRALLREEYKKYIQFVLDRVNKGQIKYEPTPEIAEELLRVAEFSAAARSPVSKDFKSGLVDEEVDKEGPGRIVKQLDALASAFIAMNQAEGGLTGKDHKEQISEHQRRILYRCAYDSIPNMRRAVLRLLCKYTKGITTSGAGMTLDLPTDSIRKYLQEVNAIGLCTRKKEGGSQGDRWVMTDKHYRRVVQIVEGIRPEDKELLGKDEDFEDWENGDLVDTTEVKKEAAKTESLMPDTGFDEW